MTTLQRKEQESARRCGRVLKADFEHRDEIHDLSGRGLTFLDMNLVLTAYGSLTTVDLSNNKLVTLPQSFSRCLGHVQLLDLSRNLIQKLPENFHLLKSLHTLILYHNRLRTLPVCFWKLDKLGWLDLAANPLDVRMQKICGVELTQGAAVARNVREYFYLLQLAAESYTQSQQSISEFNSMMQEREESHKDRIENKNGNEANVGVHQSFSIPIRGSQHGDFDFGGYTYSETDQEKTSMPKYFDLKKHESIDARSSNQKLAESYYENESEYEKETQSMATMEPQAPLHRQLLQQSLYLLLGSLLFLLTLSMVSGPPGNLLKGGTMKQYKYLPPPLMNALAWIYFCTLHQLRSFFSGVNSVGMLLFVPRSPSFFERLFG